MSYLAPMPDGTLILTAVGREKVKKHLEEKLHILANDIAKAPTIAETSINLNSIKFELWNMYDSYTTDNAPVPKITMLKILRDAGGSDNYLIQASLRIELDYTPGDSESLNKVGTYFINGIAPYFVNLHECATGEYRRHVAEMTPDDDLDHPIVLFCSDLQILLDAADVDELDF